MQKFGEKIPFPSSPTKLQQMARQAVEYIQNRFARKLGKMEAATFWL